MQNYPAELVESPVPLVAVVSEDGPWASSPGTRGQELAGDWVVSRLERLGCRLRYLRVGPDHLFRRKKEYDGKSRASDGRPLLEAYEVRGILKTSWLQRHFVEIPSVVIVATSTQNLRSIDSAPLITILDRLRSDLAGRDVRVVAVVVVDAGQGGVAPAADSPSASQVAKVFKGQLKDMSIRHDVDDEEDDALADFANDDDVCDSEKRKAQDLKAGFVRGTQPVHCDPVQGMPTLSSQRSELPSGSVPRGTVNTGEKNDDRLVASLRKRCAACGTTSVVVAWSDEAYSRLALTVTELAHQHYISRARKLKKWDRSVQARSAPLSARYNFKIAWFYEFSDEPDKAIKHYRACYAALESVLDPGLTAQVRGVAEYANFKLCHLILNEGRVCDAAAQIISHLSRSRMRLAMPTEHASAPEPAHRHWGWLCRQHVVFAELLASTHLLDQGNLLKQPNIDNLHLSHLKKRGLPLHQQLMKTAGMADRGLTERPPTLSDSVVTSSERRPIASVRRLVQPQQESQNNDVMPPILPASRSMSPPPPVIGGGAGSDDDSPLYRVAARKILEAGTSARQRGLQRVRGYDQQFLSTEMTVAYADSAYHYACAAAYAVRHASALATSKQLATFASEDSETEYVGEIAPDSTALSEQDTSEVDHGTMIAELIHEALNLAQREPKTELAELKRRRIWLVASLGLARSAQRLGPHNITGLADTAAHLEVGVAGFRSAWPQLRAYLLERLADCAVALNDAKLAASVFPDLSALKESNVRDLAFITALDVAAMGHLPKSCSWSRILSERSHTKLACGPMTDAVSGTLGVRVSTSTALGRMLFEWNVAVVVASTDDSRSYGGVRVCLELRVTSWAPRPISIARLAVSFEPANVLNADPVIFSSTDMVLDPEKVAAVRVQLTVNDKTVEGSLESSQDVSCGSHQSLDPVFATALAVVVKDTNNGHEIPLVSKARTSQQSDLRVQWSEMSAKQPRTPAALALSEPQSNLALRIDMPGQPAIVGVPHPLFLDLRGQTATQALCETHVVVLMVRLLPHKKDSKHPGAPQMLVASCTAVPSAEHRAVAWHSLMLGAAGQRSAQQKPACTHQFGSRAQYSMTEGSALCPSGFLHVELKKRLLMLEVPKSVACSVIESTPSHAAVLISGLRLGETSLRLTSCQPGILVVSAAVCRGQVSAALIHAMSDTSYMDRPIENARLDTPRTLQRRTLEFPCVEGITLEVEVPSSACRLDSRGKHTRLKGDHDSSNRVWIVALVDLDLFACRLCAIHPNLEPIGLLRQRSIRLACGERLAVKLPCYLTQPYFNSSFEMTWYPLVNSTDEPICCAIVTRTRNVDLSRPMSVWSHSTCVNVDHFSQALPPKKHLSIIPDTASVPPSLSAWFEAPPIGTIYCPLRVTLRLANCTTKTLILRAHVDLSLNTNEMWHEATTRHDHVEINPCLDSGTLLPVMVALTNTVPSTPQLVHQKQLGALSDHQAQTAVFGPWLVIAGLLATQLELASLETYDVAVVFIPLRVGRLRLPCLRLTISPDDTRAHSYNADRTPHANMADAPVSCQLSLAHLGEVCAFQADKVPVVLVAPSMLATAPDH